MYSCNEEEFLHTEPTETVSTPTIEQKVNGMYTNMIRTRTGGTTGHDDFGQKGFDIYMDLLSSDVGLSRSIYGWYRSIANFTGPVNYANNNNYIPWRYYYRMIYSANDIINDLGGEEGVLDTAEKKEFMGQARAMRAYSYFVLMQLYTKEFSASAKGIPLVTSIKQETFPTVSQDKVYALIESDLLASENLLEGFNRSQKAKINQDVARGFLAYAYAAMQQPEKAATYAAKVVNSGYPLTTKAALTGGFNAVSTPSWMWGIDITTDMGLDLVSWWGQMDMYTYSYAYVGDYKTIDENIRLKIREDDVRKNQFVKYTVSAGSYWIGMNKFYNEKKELGGQRNIESDYIYMRVDEFYLLLAESYAKSGKEALAKETLKTLLKDRITNLSYLDALSGSALLEEIDFQTRLELYGEGKSYFAMKRNKRTITRGTNHLYFAGKVYKSTDEGLTLSVPQQEVINNPNL